MSPVSIEYDFCKPIYTIGCVGKYAVLTPYGAKYNIIKNNYEYDHIGEPALKRKKLNKMSLGKLEAISNFYIFSDD